jgi:nonribosomal peptide synthetase protein BlmIX
MIPRVTTYGTAWDQLPGATPDRPTSLVSPSLVSPSQRRLWFLHHLDPDDPAYNVCLALRMRGPLNLHALAASVDGITRRHESLRSTFDDLRPARRTAPAGRVPLVVVDVTSAPHDVGQHLAVAARRPFDLATGPLTRWLLLRLAPDDHVLVFTVHHIVFDGGSLPVLGHELAERYLAGTTGAPDPLASPAPALVPSVESAAGLTYWRECLSDLMPPPPLWFGAGSDGHLRVVHHVERMDSRVLDDLRAAARSYRCTPYVVLLAALAAVVSRYTGQDEVVVGSPVAARDTSESQQRIDLLLNLLPLRLPVGRTGCFAELVRVAREVLLDAFDHRAVPFERIVAEGAAARRPDESPLFNVLLVHQQSPAPPRLVGLDVEVLTTPTASAKYHLTVTATESIDELELAFEADGAACDVETLGRFAGHLRTLLAAAVAEPSRPLRGLPLLTSPERRCVPTAAPQRYGVASGEEPAGVHELVERTAAGLPDAVAVRAEDGQLTYAELDRSANRLAHHLRAAGAVTEGVVAVHLGRTSRLVVALLAVFKAGAAYLPLDPGLPPERHAQMVRDARATVLVTSSDIEAGLESGLGFVGPVIRLDTDADDIARRPATRPAGGRVHPGGLAYVLYTSGSSGVPKGVAIEHGSAVGFLRWAGGEHTQAELRSTLAVTSVGFDLSVFELFAPLAHGGSTVVTGPSQLHSGEPFAGGASLLNTVPSVVEALLDNDALPPGLLAVNLAGEALRPDLVDRLGRHAPGALVRNLYGPSEATTYVTVARLSAGMTHTPIGRAVAGAELWLADGDGEPVPAGVSGEILVGGSAVARGYLHRSALTARQFIPDHLGAEPGSRLYRTGDVGRTGKAAELYFLGRVDNQVKIRGVRVEPEEIEAVLQQHPGVRLAAVVAVGDAPRRRRLVAFVCAEPGAETVTPAELAAFLRGRLPTPMVPAAWSLLDDVPRTANGKVDRRRLAGQADRAAPASSSSTPPRSPLEQAIADVWCETLRLPSVGVHDGFFDLGGDSLRVLELLVRVRERVDPGLRAVDLFRCPTVASLAEFVGHGDTGGAAAATGVSRAVRRLSVAQARAVVRAEVSHDGVSV